MRKFLPKSTVATIELLAALLAYNPTQRTSAADALKLDAVADIW
jgi:hypothetical protein